MEKVVSLVMDGVFIEFRPLTRKQYEDYPLMTLIPADVYYSTPHAKYQRVLITPVKITFTTVDECENYHTYTGEWDEGYVWDAASVPEVLRGIVPYDHPAIYIAALFHDSWYQCWTFGSDRAGCRKANMLFRALIDYTFNTYFPKEKQFDIRAWLGVALKGWDYYKERSTFDLLMTGKCQLSAKSSFAGRE
jgi:hypothetical protein